MKKLYASASVKVPDGESADAFPGTFEVILSTPEVDRDGESLATKCFEPLPAYVSFDIDHGMSTATTVGSGTPRYDGDLLKVAGTWSSLPRAQEVRTLVREGHIRSTSVAFMGAKFETKEGVPTITKAEILNAAFTPIPSNRGASVLSAKAFADRTGEVDVRDFRAPMFKGHGMTARDLSTAVERAVEEAHGGERVYTYLRDYTDEWAVFGVYSVQAPDRLLKQSYSVSGDVASMTGDPVEVIARTVYDEVKTDTTPKNAPADRSDTSAPSAAASSALVSARSALALAEATLALSSR